MTNPGSLSDLFKAAMKLAVACAFVSAIATAASAQTNTFPTTGNAGAGTTSPDRKLEVQDSGSPQLRLTHTDGSVYTDFQIISSGHLLISPTGPDVSVLKPVSVSADTDAFRFFPNADTNLRWALGTDASGLFHIVQKGDGWANQGTRFSINRSGNVGIGTTTPGNYKLNVNGPFAGTATFTSYIADGLYGATALPSRISTHNFNGGFLFGYEDLGLGDYSPRLGLQQTYDATGSPNITSTKASIGLVRNGNITIRGGASHTEFFRIDNSGNVGIGTPTPGAKLHVSAGDSSFALFGPNASWGGSLAVGSGNAFLTPISGRAQVLSSNGNLHLDGGSGQNVYLSWLNASNTIINGQGGTVGIGTQTPNSIYKLDVSGEINATGFRINGTPISGGSHWTPGTSSIFYNGGNVGIGTASPLYRLDVNGNVNSTGNLQSLNGSYTTIGFRDGDENYRAHAFWVGNTNANGGMYAGITNYPGANTSVVNDGMFFAAPYTNNWDKWVPTLSIRGTSANGPGNVGIGTTTPQSNLQVGSQTSGQTSTPVTLSLGGSFSNSAGANLKLRLYDDGVVGNTYGIGVSSGSMDFGVSPTASYHWYSGGVNKMTLTSNGDLSVSGNIAAKYQDLAEWVPSSEQLSAGTVVVLDTTRSNQVTSSTISYDTRVAGVISAQPGITLGEGGEGKVLVATTGRVRVKVDATRGAIQIGDLLVTSDVSGVAMKSVPVNLGGVQIHRPGTIVGKALEPLTKGSGQILVLLSLQ